MRGSFQKSAGRLVLEPRASRGLALFILTVHGAAAAAVWTAVPAWWARLPCILVIMAACVRAYTRHATLSHPRAVTRVVRPERGPWRLVTRGGGVRRVDLAGDSYVHPWLVILNFDLHPKGRTAVVLFPDSLPGDDLRRLRVHLRIAGPEGRR